jgi:hypothetical protein
MTRTTFLNATLVVLSLCGLPAAVLADPLPMPLCGSLGRSCCVIGEINHQTGQVTTEPCFPGLECRAGICLIEADPTCGNAGEICCPFDPRHPGILCGPQLACVGGICVDDGPSTCQAGIGERCCPLNECGSGTCVFDPNLGPICQ